MEMKTILRGINIGLWIIRFNKKTGECELYTDETMRKLLGVTDDIAPSECYKHWQDNIDPEQCEAVKRAIYEVAKNDGVFQVEYSWHHPQSGTITVRCSGRCVDKNDESFVFEGFHRVIGDF